MRLLLACLRRLNCKNLPVTIFALLLSIFTNGQSLSGVHGIVRDDLGNPLAFATLFVKQTGSGTTSNLDGHYEIHLPTGKYELVYQYLGYETQTILADVNGFIKIDVTLKSQTTVLQTVEIRAGNEDPAYTIMRKAVAKAKYHTQQLDAYSARVYIKGAGKLKDYPWLAKKALEKEGVEKGRVYVSESVSDIKYTRPSKFEEKVISIRSDGKDNNTSPNQYVFGSFYEPEIAETISPLSPRAFSYYRFEYLGTFKDRNYEVSRIKVTPRSKGDNVVEGEINIVEDWWSIHSMDVRASKLGISFFIKSIYAPIEDKAWLPVSHRFKVEGKVFGFEFEGNYLATVSDYKIQLNPELYVDPLAMDVIDEKIQKDEAREIQQKQLSQAKAKPTSDKAKQLQQRLQEGKEITRKELKTIIKEYEKQELKQQKEPEVISDVSIKIDSGAYKVDSTYWASIRPVPLTADEIKGYQKSDSMAVVERKKEAGDTVKASKHKGFQPWDIIIGDTYKVSKNSNFRIYTVLGGFNTVEGWNIVYKMKYGSVLQDTSKTHLTVTPTFRYAFSREVFSGNLEFALDNKNYRFELEGGRYIKQYNADEPILPLVNDFTTLLIEKNLMKLYERRYVDLLYRRRFNDKITATGTLSWAKRYELQNTSSYKLVDRSKREYTDNAPVNAERVDTTFPTHQALIASLSISARPWIKYKIRNGNKQEVEASSPTLLLNYRKGIQDALNSEVDFDQVELGIKHRFSLGVRGQVFLNLRGGAFLNGNKMYFMDYKHFLGNQTPFITNDPAATFRLLDYYGFSTSHQYFAGNIYYQFRKLLVTRFPIIRMTGIRENIFVNYLATPASHNYTEVGYAIDGILRLFRLEAAASFLQGEYKDYGFRIGIASYLTVNFSDN